MGKKRTVPSWLAATAASALLLLLITVFFNLAQAASFGPAATKPLNRASNLPAGGTSQLVGSTTLSQDLSLSSVLGVGALNATIGGQTFGTAGYLLFNYNGGPSFISCNPPTTSCPSSPNANDYNLLGGSFAAVNISITRASGISNPITQTQTGGSSYIDSGPHIFSGIYDVGPNANNQTLIINLSNLPTSQFRITVYNNNNPGGGFRNGYMYVTTGTGTPAQSVFYASGIGAVTQWLVSGSDTAQIVETNALPPSSAVGNLLPSLLGQRPSGAAGNLPVGGIFFDSGNGSPTATLPPTTNTPTSTATGVPTVLPTNTATSVPTNTATGVPTILPTNTATSVATNTPTTLPSNTATATSVATALPTQTPGGATATPIPTNTATPLLTATATNTAMPTETGTPATPTPLPSITSTSVPPSVTPTDCPLPFVDLNGNVFLTAIKYLYCRGVVNGLDASHYGPAGTSTRAQFAKVVVLGFGLPNYTPATPDFTDVPANYFAYSFIEAGYHAGILSGFDQATCDAIGAQFPCYGPGRPITRAQLTKLVVAAGHFAPFTPTSPTFVDVGTNNVFYASIETAHHYGIINGYPDNTFRPNNNIRRDEMAQIVYKGVTALHIN